MLDLNPREFLYNNQANQRSSMDVWLSCGRLTANRLYLVVVLIRKNCFTLLSVLGCVFCLISLQQK